ncbi:MAG: phosphomannomutase/phosphoglucomutase [Candidatus Hydrogenedentes bacterium]|nr:phosphomannomutase/phosphoglucomutase [Candidatus Hydrogenedentota bacterium]HPV38968.1 phosphomannomutase/phosphoglucomutase [Candidatus Hydrogenedentota bacterium]
MNPQIFREYDIRGIAGTDLTEEIYERLGQAIVAYTRGKRKNNCFVVAHDGRLTSRSYAHAVMDGITGAGVNVIDIGQAPTPLCYFGLFTLPVDGGVMITASHNPKEYNGMKVAVGTSTIHGEEIQKLYRVALGDAFPKARKPVTVTRMDLLPKYLARVARGIHVKRRLKVVVDAGNGASGPVGVPLYEQLGCEVIPLYCDVDGRFPNHHPDPTVPKNLTKLIATVKRTGADCGIGFDGDGDRIGVVNEKGEVIFGDKLLILFARHILKAEPGATIISEVKGSRTLYADIEAHGGKAIMWRTGHSLIKAAMKKFNAQLAGEMSGHMFFKHRWYGFDDAVYAGARLLEILGGTKKPLSELLGDVPKTYVTEEIRIETDEARKFEIVKQATRYFKDDLGLKVITIDGARIEFDDGWGLLRASNTSPVLVMRCEADTPKRLKEIQQLIEKKVHELNK